MSITLFAQNTTYIPDDNFEQALIDAGIDDILDDYVLTSNIENLTELNIQSKGIVDITGISGFENLEILNCAYNQIVTLDLTSNLKLTNLNCKHAAIEELIITSNIQLLDLDASNNELLSLDISGNVNIQKIDINDASLYTGGNKLTELDVSNNLELTTLNCSANNITNLDVSKNTKMISLSCAYNPLQNLNVKNGNNKNFTFFSSYWSQVSCIKVDDAEWSSTNWSARTTNSGFSEFCSDGGNTKINDNNLEQALIDLGHDSIGELDGFVPTEEIVNITDLDLSNRNIKHIAGLKAFTSLKNLNLSNNIMDYECQVQMSLYFNSYIIEKLDVSNNLLTGCFKVSGWANLKEFNCANNQLSSILLQEDSNLEKLTCNNNLLTAIDVSKTYKLETLSISDNPISQLNITNNTELKTLDVSNCGLNNINTTNNTKLESFYLNNNSIDIIDVSKNLNIKDLRVNNNQIQELDISKHQNLIRLFASDNKLTNVNIKNGNNINISNVNLKLSNNPNLTCIQVDNQQYSLDNWIFIDAQTGFSEDCSQNDAVSNYYTTVPDTDFEKVLIYYNIDDVVDGKFITKNAYYITEIITDIQTNGEDLRPIDLKGIEALKSLKKLQCGSYRLERIDLSKNLALEEINIDGKVTELDVSNLVNLKKLYCDNGELTSLNLAGAINLEILQTQGNQLTTIDVSTNTKLTWLNVSNNQLTNINVTNNTALQTFACYDNEIEYLYLGQLENLINFSAQRNNLKYLNIKNGGNKTMSDFYVKENPNLSCIQVDDEAWSSAYWASTKDDIASFSNECSAIDLPINVEGMWNDPSNWASGVVPTATDNVVIPSGTTLQISADISEINSLENDGTIVISPTFSLKSKSNMVNNGTIVMDSNADDSSVLFIVGTSTGEVKYTRGGLKANKWSLVTPPVFGQKIKEFAIDVTNDIRKNTTVTPNKYAIGFYDDSNSGGTKWGYYTENVDENLSFTAGESYAISRNTDGAVSFTGTLTTNNLDKMLKPGEWNAIGNPFTTYYPANKNSSTSFLNDNYAILDDNFKGLYVWDTTQNKYVIVSELDLQNRSFTPGQGFFIKVKADANKIEFKEAKRSIKPTTGNTGFSKRENSYIKLLANNGVNTVATDIKFFNNATTGFDIGFDIGNFDSSFDLYTHLVDKSNTNNYTIQSLPIHNEEKVIIPLGLSAKDTEVIFSSFHNSLPEDTTLVLEDRKYETFTDITDEGSTYKISVKDAILSNRFYLHVNYSKAALSLENSTINAIQIYANNKTLFVKGLKNKFYLELYNLLGQNVFKMTMNKDQEIKLPKSIKQGVYSVKLSSSTNVVTKNIIIE
ncbi:T9SS type A sorting domain-containing protein [Polaribacter sp. L3A8]|uniref:T9SS type A sorting domain-containing protein n=1 Tax=Polaribacter sp. L3A8 TaxID=2686361 RepID=UPI00131BFAB1|nr:T9SS type A sorting domain-containing protein [Polaribacter sp. L3A8]